MLFFISPFIVVIETHLSRQTEKLWLDLFFLLVSEYNSWDQSRNNQSSQWHYSRLHCFREKTKWNVRFYFFKWELHGHPDQMTKPNAINMGGKNNPDDKSTIFPDHLCLLPPEDSRNGHWKWAVLTSESRDSSQWWVLAGNESVHHLIYLDKFLKFWYMN